MIICCIFCIYYVQNLDATEEGGGLCNVTRLYDLDATEEGVDYEMLLE